MSLVAVVTGASTGIGRATALALAARGATVVGIARSEATLAELGAAASGLAGRCEVVAADVTDAGRVRAVLGEVAERHGRIDVLVNNAGTGVYAPLVETAAEEFEAVVRTNLLGAVYCTQAVLPGMLGRGSGHVINVSSPLAMAPAPGQTAYAASKAALDAFSESLMLEVRDRGVRISIVYPGWVSTPLTQTIYRDQPLPPKAVQMPPERVAEGVLRALETGRDRVYLPWFTAFTPIARALAPEMIRRQVLKTQPLRARSRT